MTPLETLDRVLAAAHARRERAIADLNMTAAIDAEAELHRLLDRRLAVTRYEAAAAVGAWPT